MPDDYTAQELARQAREIERIRDDVRNPQPPMVPLALFEEVRKTQGERIGQLEKSLRTANYVAWTAIVFPLLVAIIGGLILNAVQH